MPHQPEKQGHPQTHKKNRRDKKKGAPHEAQSRDKNEGEGNRTAARNYDRATEEYVKSGRVDAAAKAAERAIEGPDRRELIQAEETAREGLLPSDRR